MRKMIFGISAVAMMVVLMAGCSQVPTAETEKANASLEAAKTVEADRYLAAEYTALSDSLNVVLTAIEAEKEKSAGSRNFKPFAEKLTWIAANADTLALQTETIKAEMRVQVEEEMATLTATVAQNKEMVSKIVKTTKNAEEVDAMMNQVTMIEAAIAEINTLVANGDYLTAHEKVVATKEMTALAFASLASSEV
jgi:wobble nucleotide-excising tRNase